MGKLRTAAALLASGSFSRFRDRLRLNLRGRRLRRAAGRPFVYRLGGVPCVCVPGIVDSEETYVTAGYDRRELALLGRWLEAGDVFVDVGANMGTYTFFASHYLDGQGSILAIDASAAVVAALRLAAGLLGRRNIVLEEKAAGDAVKEVVFYDAPVGESTEQQSLYPTGRMTDYVPRRIQMSTLAEIVQRHPFAVRPAAVKLDIEGAEILALKGAPAEWFGPAGPLWIVEVNPGMLLLAGASAAAPAALAAQFPSSSFECWLLPHYSLTGARHLPTRKLSADESFSDALYYNLIAVPRAAAFAERRRRLGKLLAVRG
jgi:FkbM family methyltransferase